MTYNVQQGRGVGLKSVTYYLNGPYLVQSCLAQSLKIQFTCKISKPLFPKKHLHKNCKTCTNRQALILMKVY